MIESAVKLTTMRWRNVGPTRGGRSVAVAGDPDDIGVFYFGACAGGVWKTTDGGTYWRNVSDGYLSTSAIGAIAVSDSSPSTVWVGTGEACVRNNVVQGDGVYRSIDKGESWQHRGLAESRHISRVRIHPTDSNTVYVAALGDIFGPSSERGVYRTVDGGENWEPLLFVSDQAGAADLVIDPTNPQVIFAAIWQVVRRPWELVSGGPDSDLYRSIDGGVTWQQMSSSAGFPTALKGRIGVCISPARPERVYAIVEAGDGQSGMYRSDDRGDSWQRVNADSCHTGRAWYYSHVFADPLDPETVYTCNLGFWRSRDGGETFTQIQTPHGDNHDLWLDPADPRRMIQANDGGACVSFNGGMTFSTVYNQSTAQIYRLDVGSEFPFDLFGTQQDNSGIRVPSRSWKGAIRWPDCLELGEAEAGDVACDPADPRFVFLGGAGFGHPGPLLRFDQATEQPQDVAVWVEHFMGTDPVTHRHRFGWTYPIEFSPHDPRILYVCGERVFRSTDGGMNWIVISPDLSTNDASKLMASGGPINKDTSGAEMFCTIHAFAESRLTAGELWAGTDDGLLHVSHDAGEHWQLVTPPELPPLSTIVSIEPSAAEPGTVYVAAHRYRLQDRTPYLFVSANHGASWSSLGAGLPVDRELRCVRQDRSNPAVLYVATEDSVQVSLDAGRSWQPLGTGLPPVPMYDLKFRDHELVVATHGRGFWILDDLTPVREGHASRGDLTLHTPPLTYRYPTPNGFDMPGEGTWVGGLPGVPLGGASFTAEQQPDGSVRNVFIDGGENPPNGLAIWYRVGVGLADQPVRITFFDEAGQSLRTFTSVVEAGQPKSVLPLPASNQGLHRQVWDLRIRPALAAPDRDGVVEALTPGPRVPPGNYRVEVTVGEQTRTARACIVADPRIFSDDEALRAQYLLLVNIRDQLDKIGLAVARIHRALASDGEEDETPSPKSKLLRQVELRLVGGSSSHGAELKNAPGLAAKIKLLPEIVVELSDTAPTQAVCEVWAKLDQELTATLDGLNALIGTPGP